MGSYLSTDNWAGAALILVGSLIAVWVSIKSTKKFRNSRMKRYGMMFIICFMIAFGAGVGGIYYGTRNRCKEMPGVLDVLKMGLVPGLLTAIITLVAQIVGDVARTPMVLIVTTLIRYFGPIAYVLFTMPGVIGAVPCKE